ncbi:AAA family ATPase [Salinisphaera sp. T31B1]|uniref:zeta toxin family protein n=1 Tax=Salinisphaera sp. T31B1 TaxID=727963 RepID=UPI00333EEED9
MELEPEAESRPTLHLIVGPNGAGKSTLYEKRVAPATNAPFVNADVIQQQAAAAGEALDAYEAARRAQGLRLQLMAERRSFITETVFSHPSKLELIQHAKASGYRVVLYHVNVETADICVERVRIRVALGGHDVPEEKIRQRYERNQRYIADAARLCDVALIYDSSKAFQPQRWVLTLRDGAVDAVGSDLPPWVQRIYEV